MPCLSGDEITVSAGHVNTLAERAEFFEALCCGILTTLDTSGMDLPCSSDGLFKYHFDFKEAGVDKTKVLRWWRDHKKRDEQRRKEEAKKAKQRALVDRALDKLSPEETEALRKEFGDMT